VVTRSRSFKEYGLTISSIKSFGKNDTTKAKSSAPEGVLNTGLQFQEMCAPSPSSSGFFSVHLLTFSYSLLEDKKVAMYVIGERDAKDEEGKYVELKCSSSHPRHWHMDSDNRLVAWIASTLSNYRILVRGHRNKYTDELDKIDPSTLIAEWNKGRYLQTLHQRLNIILNRMDLDGRYVISCDPSLPLALSISPEF